MWLQFDDFDTEADFDIISVRASLARLLAIAPHAPHAAAIARAMVGRAALWVSPLCPRHSRAHPTAAAVTLAQVYDGADAAARLLWSGSGRGIRPPVLRADSGARAPVPLSRTASLGESRARTDASVRAFQRLIGAYRRC